MEGPVSLITAWANLHQSSTEPFRQHRSKCLTHLLVLGVKLGSSTGCRRVRKVNHPFRICNHAGGREASLGRDDGTLIRNGRDLEAMFATFGPVVNRIL